MISLVKSNPNAIVSLVGTGVAYLAVYLLGRYFNVHPGSEYQLAIAGGVSSGLLFLGRKGIMGAVNFVLHGRSGGASKS